ncbi:MAG: hypothetical protein LBL04_13510 [Bacteroidales bacterium]|jgi:hypothetical protein|nr:hypothetical protein [Bacteroidales bacterium]
MKQLVKLSVIVCLVAVMSGCKDKDEAPYFRMGSQQLTQVFGPEGGTGYFTVSTNQKFTATASESWCTVTVIEGKTEKNLTIEVSPRQATTDRQATVTIACSGFTSQMITVTQTGVEITFEVTPPENHTVVAWQGEDIVFTVNSSETWAYEITPNSGWLTEKAKNATTLTLAAASNPGAIARNATVRFFLPEYADVSEEIDLAQKAQFEISLSVSFDETVFIPKEGGNTGTITVTTNADEWNYTAPAWLTNAEKNATTLTLTAVPATLGSRIGVVTITAGDKSQQVEVIQRGLADILDLIFHADGTATNIADPDLPIVTVPYEKTEPDDIERLTTVRSETYRRYVARFAHTSWTGNDVKTLSGFYRLEYGTVADKLTDGHSMEALVSMNTLKDYAKIIGGHQGGGAALYFGNNASSGKFVYEVHTGSAYTGPAAPSAAVAGTYYHLVGVYDKSTGMHLYINGELASTYSVANASMVLPQSNNRWIGIGADTGENKAGEYGLDGNIAIARIYDAPLTAEQVAALYAEINE